jgi:hypothetical protein
MTNHPLDFTKIMPISSCQRRISATNAPERAMGGLILLVAARGFVQGRGQFDEQAFGFKNGVAEGNLAAARRAPMRSRTG